MAKRRARRREPKVPAPEAPGPQPPPPPAAPDAAMADARHALPEESEIDDLARTATAALMLLAGLLRSDHDRNRVCEIVGALDAVPEVREARGAVRGYEAAMKACYMPAVEDREERSLPMRRALGLALAVHVPGLPDGYTVIGMEPSLSLPAREALTEPLAHVTVAIQVPGRPGLLRATAATTEGLRAAIVEALNNPEEN